MNEKIKIKNIIFYSIFLLITIIIVNYVVKPYEAIDYSKADRAIKKACQAQKIAPQRLYINAWRLAKLEYVDSTMNYQNWFRWRNRYLKEIKTLEDAQVAINTMLFSLNDPYTKFLETESYLRQKIILDSKITGVGVIFDKTGDDIIINNVLKNSSAQDEKLLPGDRVVSVDGVDVKNLSSDNVQNVVDNGSGKKVTIKIQRGKKIITKVLQKREINIDTMQYLITDDNIGIINLANVMGENAIKDFKNILVQTNNTKGLIIDLRDNYGGLLTNAILMSDYMSDDKKLISIESRGSTKYQLYGDRPAIFQKKPIVILVNHKTASAAEILAGNLKDNAEAIIIGEQTYGKNTIQQIIPMANNTGLIITSDKYILPNGEDIYKIGIKPDIIINKTYDKYGRDIALNKAVAIIKEMSKK